jgi:hypothetical protein
MSAHKKIVSLCVTVFLACPVFAQQQANGAGSRTAQIRILGCIAGEKRYTFMQASTGAEFALTGDSQQFASARGKFSEITGSEYAPDPNSRELPQLRVKSVRVIADQCPIHAGGAPTTAAPTSEAPRSRPSPATAPYAEPGGSSRTPPNMKPNIQGDTGAPSPGTGNKTNPPR